MLVPGFMIAFLLSTGAKAAGLKGDMEVPGPGKYNPNVSASLSGGVAAAPT